MVAGPTAVILAGPTASGKTNLAISLAQSFPLGLISVDAAQVYRGMDVGTAKPSPLVLKQFPHALIDIREPSETFSAGAFCEAASREVRRLVADQKIPMLVGGTMFYFWAVTGGLDRLPPADRKARQRIEEEAEQLGWEALHSRLEKLDPDAARRIDHRDGQRIQRALEINQLTGESVGASGSAGPTFPSNTRVIRLAIAFSDRGMLHKRIERRVDQMLDLGFVEEVQRLVRNGLAPNAWALRAVGYRQVHRYLKGELTYAAMRNQTIAATRQLAKRQLTWLRKTPGFVWFDASDGNIYATVQNYLKAQLPKMG